MLILLVKSKEKVVFKTPIFEPKFEEKSKKSGPGLPLPDIPRSIFFNKSVPSRYKSRLAKPQIFKSYHFSVI